MAVVVREWVEAASMVEEPMVEVRWAEACTVAARQLGAAEEEVPWAVTQEATTAEAAKAAAVPKVVAAAAGAYQLA